MSRKHIVCILWAVLVLCVGAGAASFVLIAKGWIGYVPEIDQLQKPISKYATQIISDDNVLLGTWSKQENRIFVNYDQISPFLIKALVSTEDERFYEHSGIDGKSLMRAIVKRGILRQHNAGGGSTITQQLAKQLYSETASSSMERLLQKPIEWVIAVKLERYYTKDELITLYLNYFDFLYGAVGIKMASNIYFGKQPGELSLTEAATLVGMCKNPSYYNPVTNPERCKNRRNVVLGQMYKAGKLTKAEFKEHSLKPLELNFHRVDHKTGLATYLREYLRIKMTAEKPNPSAYASWQKQKYYDDSLSWEEDPLYGWCNKNKKKDGRPYNIYTDGLKIYTTINSRLQQYAEESVKGHLSFLQRKFNEEGKRSRTFPFSSDLSLEQRKSIISQSIRQSDRYRTMKDQGIGESEILRSFHTPQHMVIYTPSGGVDTLMTPLDSILYYKSFLRSGFMVMDPHSGYVKAYIGGLNYHYFQYDMCSDGRRQVGSTIKPFLYSLAMENGFQPNDLAPNEQHTYIVAGQPWTPRNASRAHYGEMVTLKWGLAQSNNWISAYLMSQLDPVALVDMIHQFGVTNQEIVPSMSLCLGPCDISVKELTSAYTAFANKGIRVEPLFVSRIEDNAGNIVATFQPKMNEVISELSSYKMLAMLQGIVDQGTGRRLRYRHNITAPMAGKTGTTNNHSDSWFVGVAPRLVGACWVGGENRSIRFNNMAYGQGASAALPVWGYFMTKVYRDKSLGYSQTENFEFPEGFSLSEEEKEDNDDNESETNE